MYVVFLIIAVLTLAGAVAAVTLRNLVHCVLMLVLAFGGLAVLYLQLGAQFAGFAQVLVYVGAVAILIVFALLLTRGGDAEPAVGADRPGLAGLGIAAVVFIVLGGCILASGLVVESPAHREPATVAAIGEKLMTVYVLPLQVIGVLLTAALIGAVIIALREKGNSAP